jgi:hypothetical protein
MNRRRKPKTEGNWEKIAVGMLLFGLLCLGIQLGVHNWLGRLILSPLASG